MMKKIVMAGRPWEILLGKDIAAEDRENQRGGRADDRAQHGDNDGIHHAGIVKDQLIGAKDGMVRNNDEVVALDHLSFRREGHAQHVEEREQAHQRDDPHEDHDDNLIGKLRARHADFIFSGNC